MGRVTVRYLREKNVEVVAAYVRTIEGKDFSAPELAGVEICQPHVGQAALAGAQQLAGAAQLQVLLGTAESVLRLAHDGKS